MRQKAWAAALLILTVLITAGILSAFRFGGGKIHQTEKAFRGSIEGSIEETGEIEGEKEYTCFANVTAPVLSFPLKEGDVIQKGDTLLLYDSRDLIHSVSQAAITRIQSEEDAAGKIKKSNEYKSKYDQAAFEDAAYAGLYWLERESLDLLTEGQYAKGYYIECDADGIRRRIAKKQEDVADKQAEYAGLSEEAKAAEQGLSLQREIAELNSDIAELNGNLAGLPNSMMNPADNAKSNDTKNIMEDITRNWTQAKTQKNAYEEGILNDEQKSALQRQAELSADRETAAREELEKAEAGIIADFRGVITECSVKEGAYVTKGTPLFKIVGSDDMKVTVMISKYDIGKIREGQRAVIETGGESLPGTVSRINHVATEDDSDKKKVAVDVHINEIGAGVILGLEADVTIFTEAKNDALLIPAEAYYSDNDGDYCYTIQDETVNKVYFTPGIRTDTFVEVLDGLAEDTVVITDAVTDKEVGKKAMEAAK